MFSPPSIPAVNPKKNVFRVEEGEPLPWDADHPLRRKWLDRKQAWRYTVYVGVFACGAVYEALRKVFPGAWDAYDEHSGGETALLAFTVSEDGHLVEGSVVLSACAWAMTRALVPGPNYVGWLDGFRGDDSQMGGTLEGLFIGDDEDSSPTVLDWNALEESRRMAINAIGIPDGFSIGGIRVGAWKTSRANAANADHDFLNSFITDDLARVAQAASEGDVGRALSGYLRPNEELDLGGRIDVRERIDVVRRLTAPDRIPLGRWPAAPSRPLALGQQLAVNQAVAMQGGAGDLFAVNGPPGTGKTTMLRDLVAALVTERAECLAKLVDPEDAFVGKTSGWQGTQYRRSVRRLRPELTGFEMVVASSNNNAVNNITLEIPSGGAIDEVWREEAKDPESLQILAERLISMIQPDSDDGDPDDGDLDEDDAAWALVAAPLGKSKNRKAFSGAVWWDPKDEGDEVSPGLRKLLVGWSDEPEGPSWSEAVATFEKVRDRVVSIRDERLASAATLDLLEELAPQLEDARAVEREARRRIIASRPRRDQLAGELRDAEAEGRGLVQQQEEAVRQRPCILRFRARAEWRRHVRQIGGDLAANERRQGEIGADLRPLEAEVDAYEEARELRGHIKADCNECEAALRLYRQVPGAVLPDAAWHDDRSRREIQAPWTDVEWNQARTELFLAALALHRAFLVGAASQLRRNLDGAMEIIQGAAPLDLRGTAAEAAWQTLFLVVPVVSTTFASLGRLFRHLGPESLGWLLVDEAGQATPQNAVGGLWRCRRAMVVGDPLQLKPISTIPFKLEQAIREHHRVGEEWLTRESAQTVADRVNRLGTYLPGRDERVWIGSPLTVHRRCDLPMFDISNEIAYDGSMIKVTDPTLEKEFTAAYPDLPPSTWMHVATTEGEAQGHWIPAEGRKVERLLDQLAGVGFDFRQVMAIGPYRDIAAELVALGRRYPRMKAGTIHTAQGREADIVILVLGSDPRRPRAREWAAKEPNLLNVAVSRAKRRLYVVGDCDRWKDLRYFDVLDRELRS